MAHSQKHWLPFPCKTGDQQVITAISINKQSYAATQERHQLPENKLSPYCDAYTPTRHFIVRGFFFPSVFQFKDFISHICNEITSSNIELFGTGREYIIIEDRFEIFGQNISNVSFANRLIIHL